MTASPEMASLGSGRLLALTYDFSEEDVSTVIDVIDVSKDKISAQIEVKEYLTFASAFDGGFILRSYQEDQFYYYDYHLNVTKYFAPDNMAGEFTADGNGYYEVVGGRLCREDVETGELVRVEVSPEFEFSEAVSCVTPDGKYVELSYQYSKGEEFKTAVIRVELESGKADIMSYDIIMPVYGDRNMYLYDYDENGNGSFCSIPSQGGDATAFELSECSIIALENSDWLICYQTNDISQDWEMPEEADFTQMYLGYIDDSSTFMATKITNEESEEFLSFLYMPEEKRIAFSCEENGVYRIGLFEPQLFDYEELMEGEKNRAPQIYDEEVYTDYLEVSKIPECPEYLKPLREEADKLEEEFGITLYMSDECRDMVHDIGYNCTNDDFEQEMEYTLLEIALEEIENTLLKYPDAFFLQFKDKIGEGGIRICLTSKIQDDFSAAYAVKINQWYNIVLDVNYNNEFNLSHELWHSTESLINLTDESLLDEEQWEMLNPDGFEYYGEYFSTGMMFTEYCFNSGDEWYFYDDYGKMNSYEDKARIMEIVMCPDYYPRDDFVQSEQIKKKLAVMCHAVRETFDTTGWDDVYWERFMLAET